MPLYLGDSQIGSVKWGRRRPWASQALMRQACPLPRLQPCEATGGRAFRALFVPPPVDPCHSRPRAVRSQYGRRPVAAKHAGSAGSTGHVRGVGVPAQGRAAGCPPCRMAAATCRRSAAAPPRPVHARRAPWFSVFASEYSYAARACWRWRPRSTFPPGFPSIISSPMAMHLSSTRADAGPGLTMFK